MRRLIQSRLASQLQHATADVAYGDKAFYYPPMNPDTGLDSYGQPTTQPAIVPIDCSFTDKPATERWRGDIDLAELSAEVRFAGLLPDKGGKFLLVEHFADPNYVDTLYEIIGVQDRGTFGIVSALKKVQI